MAAEGTSTTPEPAAANKDGGGFMGIISIAAIVPIIVLAAILGFSTGFGSKGTDQANGSTSGPETINPDTSTANGTNADAPAIEDLVQLADTPNFLSTTGAATNATFSAELSTIAAGIAPSSSDPTQPANSAYSYLLNRDQVTTIINSQILPELNIAKQNASGANISQTPISQSKIKAELQSIEKLQHTSPVPIAIQMAKDNVSSNYTKYPFSIADRTNLLLGKSPASSDGSSFISYLLYKSGENILKTNALDSEGIYLAAEGGDYDLSIVAEATDTVPLTSDQLSAANLKPGDIILSAASPFDDGKSASMNAAMYVGPDSSHPSGDMVESSLRGTKNGVQFNTLAFRLANTDKAQAIIRFDQ